MSTRQWKTWHIEAAVIASCLCATVLVDDPSSWVAWLGAGAVFLTSRHMSVADRLREKEEHGLDAPVTCVGWPAPVLTFWWGAGRSR